MALDKKHLDSIVSQQLASLKTLQTTSTNEKTIQIPTAEQIASQIQASDSVYIMTSDPFSSVGAINHNITFVNPTSVSYGTSYNNPRLLLAIFYGSGLHDSPTAQAIAGRDSSLPYLSYRDIALPAYSSISLSLSQKTPDPITDDSTLYVYSSYQTDAIKRGAIVANYVLWSVTNNYSSPATINELARCTSVGRLE